MYCSKCGGAVDEGASFCAACGQPTGVTSAMQPATEGVPPAPPQPSPAPGVLYAGFWLRVVAAIIDNLVLLIPVGFLYAVVLAGAMPMLVRAASSQNPMYIVMTFAPRLLLLGVVVVIIRWLYWASLESSAWQATLGKKALGLYVTDLECRRTTFGRSSGRFWAGRGIFLVPYIGWLYYLIDCILVAFTEKKQALHDTIANCLVLRKA